MAANYEEGVKFYLGVKWYETEAKFKEFLRGRVAQSIHFSMTYLT
jgi:hypothetical protein